jgi:hypothetical protein
VTIETSAVIHPQQTCQDLLRQAERWPEFLVPADEVDEALHGNDVFDN